MKNNPLFNTVSMASLCARQGYLEESAAIYLCLLEQEPSREDVKAALAEVQARLLPPPPPADKPDKPDKPDTIDAPETESASDSGTESLEELVEEWVSLLVEHDLKQKFKKISSKVGRLGVPSSS